MKLKNVDLVSLLQKVYFLTAKIAKHAKEKKMEPSPELEKLGKIVVNASYEVHKQVGPGLLESVYEMCLSSLLLKEGLKIERQKAIPVSFYGEKMETGFRADIIVEDSILIELKSIEKLSQIHEAQILTYLKLSKLGLGFLINFNVPLFKQGIRRFVNQDGLTKKS